ncbi:MAG: hypothetical protein EWV50_12970 [Microcystis aeruginosa Ma_MB_F_20061100_S20]|uniref:Uncharacterized protein n=1 Tax=Microcystis aeruginosa Ma_MB_F_20061100_S20D TaxID=2486253 RepID=A0A552ERU4_MICAE|nr:MAG: hypothetical protein EWV78_07600 [Microcystis aeruginosa Ma_MB_F_20061100_S20D]TRU37627.1 MAG: hypothetical protein EWV50_12970 [Microcystis aeruginosa Ma_MB_F_20061100_S20]
MGYYFEHQEEIDRQITQEWDQIQVSMTRIAKSPFYTRMKEVTFSPPSPRMHPVTDISRDVGL